MITNFESIIKARKKIYIYGAGNYGKQVYRYLFVSGCKDRISSFVVTTSDQGNESIYGVPVVSYDSQKDSIRESIILLAMSEKTAGTVYETLRKDLQDEIYPVSRGDYLKLNELIVEKCREMPIEHNKVFFSCFMGRVYTCNCKYIAEELIRLNCNIDMVWELSDLKDDNTPQEIRTVEIGSPEHLIEWYTSKVIVCNSGLNGTMRKREGQFIIDTWHGIGPTKKMGVEANCDKDKPEVKEYFERVYEPVDLMTAASDLCDKNYRKAFLYRGEVMKCGYPRNDIFFKKDKEELKERIRNSIGIQSKELMVLYAPTYRYEQRKGGELSEMRQKV